MSTKETLNSYYQLKKITFRNPMLIIFLEVQSSILSD